VGGCSLADRGNCLGSGGVSGDNKSAESKEVSEGDHLFRSRTKLTIRMQLQCCKTDEAKTMISKAMEDVHALDYSLKLSGDDREAQKQAQVSIVPRAKSYVKTKRFELLPRRTAEL
jgi:hypothetical protein